jgi:hypothetical protein
MASVLVDARSAPEAPRTGTDTSPPHLGDQRESPFLPAVLLAAASALLAWCIFHHAMWFDEVQAWNIARASHSLPDLLSNLRYEGHPTAWYLPLFALTRLTADPRAMQLLEWAIVTATYAIVLFRAPFRLALRVAVIAGYFVTYEFGVISRSYSLELLMVVLALVLLGRPRPAWARVTLLLIVVSWTTLAGGVLAIAVAIVVLGEALRVRRGGAPWPSWRPRVLLSAVVIGSAGVAAVMCVPPADYHSFALGIPSTPLTTFSPNRFLVSLSGPWRGLFPLPAGLGRWNTNFLDSAPHATTLQALLGVGLIVGVAAALRRHRFAFRLWVLGALGYVAFSYVVVLPDRSHYAGEWFVLFLAAVWLAAAPPLADRDEQALRIRGASAWSLGAVVTVVVAAQLLATLTIMPDQTLHEFAPNRTLAAAATAHGLQRDIVSAQDFDAITMAAYLEQPVFSIARGTDLEFFPNDEREARGYEHLTDQKIECRAAQLAQQRGRPVGLVTDRELPVVQGITSLRSSEGITLLRVTPGHAAATCE